MGNISDRLKNIYKYSQPPFSDRYNKISVAVHEANACFDWTRIVKKNPQILENVSFIDIIKRNFS